MRRLSGIALALLAVTAGAALAAKGDPQERLVAADQARARAIVLKRADLPGTGWQAERSGGRGGDVTCAAFDPDLSDLVKTGEGESPAFTRNQGLTFVSSLVTLFASDRQGAAAWSRVVKPGLLACLRSVIEEGASSPGLTVETVGSGRLALPRLSPRQAAYRVRLRLTTKELTLPMFADLVLLGRGRAQALVFAVQAAEPFPTSSLRVLAGLVAGRMGSVR